MARSTTKELTSGSPMKLILGFTIASVRYAVSTVLQSHGHHHRRPLSRRDGALLQLSISGSINFLIIGFCQEYATVWSAVPSGSVRATMTACAEYVGNSAILSVLIGGVHGTDGKFVGQLMVL